MSQSNSLGLAGLIRVPQYASLLLLVLVLGTFAALNGDFLSPLNVSNMLAFLPELGIIALGMTLLLTAGEFDLSVGATFALVPAVGLINGVIVTKIGISSFLVTLSMLMIIRGAALYITQGFPLASWDQPGVFVTLLAGDFYIGPFRVYASMFWFAVLSGLAGYVLNRAKIGNWISAIGSNRNAAVARGVPADQVKVWLFVLTSVLAGLAGMISAFRISTASPVAGTGYELEVIAMVVVGGTALNGGRGTILGTVVGALMLRGIRNGIVLIGVPGLAYNIFVGAVILAMLMLHAALQNSGRKG